MIFDLAMAKPVYEHELGPAVPEPGRGKKSGFMTGVKGKALVSWHDVRLSVSETHAFLTNASGQIVVLKRDTGEFEQVVEIDGMPHPGMEPIIYEGRLLVMDVGGSIYCFEGGT